MKLRELAVHSALRGLSPSAQRRSCVSRPPRPLPLPFPAPGLALQSCYGVPELPDQGDMWLCRACELKEEGNMAPQCCLCPVAGGALKPTSIPDRWCHAACLQWIPEVGGLGSGGGRCCCGGLLGRAANTGGGCRLFASGSIHQPWPPIRTTAHHLLIQTTHSSTQTHLP